MEPDLPALPPGLAFGRAVRALRKAAGYSQEDFADAIGLHRTSMSMLERGDGNPTLATLLRIAQGLKLSLGALFLAVEQHVGEARGADARAGEAALLPRGGELLTARADVRPGMASLARAPVLQAAARARRTAWRRRVARPPWRGVPGSL